MGFRAHCLGFEAWGFRFWVRGCPSEGLRIPMVSVAFCCFEVSHSRFPGGSGAFVCLVGFGCILVVSVCACMLVLSLHLHDSECMHVCMILIT